MELKIIKSNNKNANAIFVLVFLLSQISKMEYVMNRNTTRLFIIKILI